MAETYDVYFGPTGDLSLISFDQSELSIIVPSTLEYNVEYSWRVDATNEFGTTTGDVWSFTAIVYDPPLPSGITLDGDGNPTGTPTGLNNMVTLKRIVVAANNSIFYET
ncbi:hypothetical protein LCGC14_1825040 [marine sediment metagenome]|uniref:SbsA Ig-like domain-containing protein n=1 Tax=marine sediment metagenome TaxID=412755 RepID=A0A0F9JHB1_9ZZZZ